MRLRRYRSVLSEEKKSSIAALSQPMPERLIEQTPPMVTHLPFKLVASVLITTVGVAYQLRYQIVITRVLATSYAVSRRW